MSTSNESINNEILNTAQQIGMPSTIADIYDAQFIYWQAVQNQMRSGGYAAVQLRFPCVSKKLATEIANSDYLSLKRICQGLISTLQPSIQEDMLINTLKNNIKPDAKMALQTLGAMKNA